ncbi:MAG: hypothetical protein M3519_07875, partial [Actinomycetota bacterium]|nr:hypothetical protein [Actinomycetota bacterium]
RGWDKITGGTGEFVTREDLHRRSRLARLMAIADPLISRGVNLRVAYVFGQGITIGAHEADDQAAQDVNAVVQAFLEDNTATFTSGQAREAQERCLATDGNLFHRPAGDRLRARPDRRGRSHRADREARPQAAHRHPDCRLRDREPRFGSGADLRPRRVNRCTTGPALPHRRPR